jgi:hypothetical protein
MVNTGLKVKLPVINRFRASFSGTILLKTGQGLAGELREVSVQQGLLMAVAYAGCDINCRNELKPKGGLIWWLIRKQTISDGLPFR